MKTKLSTAEIRRRAIRAAGKVALLSTLACGGEAATTELELGYPDPIGSEPTIADPTITNPSQRSAEVPAEDRTAQLIDTRDYVTEGATVAVTLCERGEAKTDWEAYLACCEAIGWDWNRGCAAWGPPVPPSLEVA
jgi:hypothetical protein